MVPLRTLTTNACLKSNARLVPNARNARVPKVVLRSSALLEYIFCLGVTYFIYVDTKNCFEHVQAFQGVTSGRPLL